MAYKVNKSEEDWEKELSREEFHVIRKKGTERPFSGEYTMKFERGIYSCKACGKQLFDSDSKFNAHCGWPSFDSELESAGILKIRDTSHGMIRTEIVCADCGAHLGHLFDDGPTQTGLRYCVNSISLTFQNEK